VSRGGLLTGCSSLLPRSKEHQPGTSWQRRCAAASRSTSAWCRSSARETSFWTSSASVGRRRRRAGASTASRAGAVDRQQAARRLAV